MSSVSKRNVRYVSLLPDFTSSSHLQGVQWGGGNQQVASSTLGWRTDVLPVAKWYGSIPGKSRENNSRSQERCDLFYTRHDTGCKLETTQTRRTSTASSCHRVVRTASITDGLYLCVVQEVSTVNLDKNNFKDATATDYTYLYIIYSVLRSFKFSAVMCPICSHLYMHFYSFIVVAPVLLLHLSMFYIVFYCVLDRCNRGQMSPIAISP